MEVKVCYSPEALEATVKYVNVHARHRLFSDKEQEIRKSVLDAIQELVDQFPRTAYIHRNGFYVWISDYIEEGIDHDENIMNVEFMVDPALGTERFSFIFTTYRSQS